MTPSNQESVLQQAIETVATRPVVLVDGQASLRRLAQLLTDESIGVAIVRGHHPPTLVSERDLVRAIADGARPDRATVDDIMTLDVACASRLEPLGAVAHTMLDNEIRHVPVVDDGAVVTVVSGRDILRALVEAAEGTAQ